MEGIKRALRNFFRKIMRSAPQDGRRIKKNQIYFVGPLLEEVDTIGKMPQDDFVVDSVSQNQVISNTKMHEPEPPRGNSSYPRMGYN